MVHKVSIKYYPAQSRKEFRSGLATYDPHTSFNQAIYNTLFRNPEGLVGIDKINIGDLMSGPGRLGIDVIFKRYKEYCTSRQKMPELMITFNDLRQDALNEAMKGLREVGGKGNTICCDVREIDRHMQAVLNGVVIRYAIKDLPKYEVGENVGVQAIVALNAVRNIMISGSRIVLGEMFSYTLEGQRGFVAIHGGKQILAGRDANKEGMCHIPTLLEWNEYLTEAGFGDIEVIYKSTSNVKMEQWRGQFGKEADEDKILACLREKALKEAKENPVFAREARIREVEDENGMKDVEIRFPIAVFTAVKR